MILFFCYLNCNDNNCTHMKKDETLNLTIPCTIIDISDFDNYTDIMVNITLRSGKIDKVMNVEGYKTVGYHKTSKVLDSYFPIDYTHLKPYTIPKGGKYYQYNNQKFIIPIESEYEQYYLYFPSYVGHYIEVKIRNSGLLYLEYVLIIIAIVIAVMVVIVLVIIINKKTDCCDCCHYCNCFHSYSSYGISSEKENISEIDIIRISVRESVYSSKTTLISH